VALALLASGAAPLFAQSQSFSIPEAPGRARRATAAAASTVTGPLAKFEPPGDAVYHGASLPRAWEEAGLRAEMDEFKRASGKRLSVVTWFASLYEGGRMTSWKQNYLTQPAACATCGRDVTRQVLDPGRQLRRLQAHRQGHRHRQWKVRCLTSTSSRTR
jgi:hypothetical protein